MSPFSLQNHTADVRLRISGKSLKELFSDALRGMVTLLSDQKVADESGEKIAFNVSAPDAESLLVDFLNEALFLMQTHKGLVSTVHFTILNKAHTEGFFFVTPIQEFAEDIKAATYHDLSIKRQADGSLETTIVFDI